MKTTRAHLSGLMALGVWVALASSAPGAPRWGDESTPPEEKARLYLNELTHPDFRHANHFRNRLFALGDVACSATLRRLDYPDSETRLYQFNLLAALALAPEATDRVRATAREALVFGIRTDPDDAIRAYCLRELSVLDPDRALVEVEGLAADVGPQTARVLRALRP